MNCKNCHKQIIRKSPNANNKKYCSVLCREEYYRKTGKRKEAYDKANRKKYNQKGEGKIKCPFCEGYYKALLYHVRQRHEMSAREYKEKYGLPYDSSILTPELKAIKSEAVSEEVIKENLIKKGEKTRFKKGVKAKPHVRLFRERVEKAKLTNKI